MFGITNGCLGSASLAGKSTRRIRKTRESPRRGLMPQKKQPGHSLMGCQGKALWKTPDAYPQAVYTVRPGRHPAGLQAPSPVEHMPSATDIIRHAVWQFLIHPGIDSSPCLADLPASPTSEQRFTQVS